MSEHVFFNNGLVDVASIYPVSISIEQNGISTTYENVTACSGMYPYLGNNKDNSQVLSDEEVDYTNVY